MTTTTKDADVDKAARELLKQEESERLEQARERARQQVEQQRVADERAALVESVKDRVRSMDRSRHEQDRERALEALDRYAAGIAAWNAEVDALAATPGASLNLSGRELTIDDVTVRRVGLQSAIASLALEIVRKHQPRGFISLDQPLD